MWPFKVRCSDCGFMYPNERCLKGCGINRITTSVKKVGTKIEAISRQETINSMIKCPMYLKKIYGLTPEQHLEHKLYKGPGVSISRWALFWSIVAVLVSVGALIVSVLKS